MREGTFGWAIEQLQNTGHKVRRDGWNGKGMFLFLVENWDFQFASGNPLGLPIQPFIMMKTNYNELVPWVASQTDVLAEDWEIVE
jgi:hypothetical protein